MGEGRERIGDLWKCSLTAILVAVKARLNGYALIKMSKNMRNF